MVSNFPHTSKTKVKAQGHNTEYQHHYHKVSNYYLDHIILTLLDLNRLQQKKHLFFGASKVAVKFNIVIIITEHVPV